MEQLNRWYKELIRLSETDYKKTDSELYNFYKDALKLLKIEIKQYIDEYETLSFSKQLEAERLIKVADRVDEILTDLNKKSGSIIRQHIDLRGLRTARAKEVEIAQQRRPAPRLDQPIVIGGGQ